MGSQNGNAGKTRTAVRAKATLKRLRNLAASIYAKHAPEAGCELDDLVAAGWIGLKDAHRKALDKGARFPMALAFRRAEGAMLDELRKWQGTPAHRKGALKERSRVELAQLTDAEWEALDSPVTNSEPDTSTSGLLPVIVLDLLPMLTQREQQVIQLVYLEGLPVAVVVTRLGIARSSVDVYRSSALKKLRSMVELEEVVDTRAI